MEQPLDNTAVLFVDAINDFDFDGGEDLLRHANEVLPNMRKLKDFAKEHGLPTIYVNDHYGLWQADYHKLIDHCRNQTNKHIIDAQIGRAHV